LQENNEESNNKNRVQQLIDALGIHSISDEELDRGIDKLLSDLPKDTPFGKLMGEARRRFIYRADLSKVAQKIREKKHNEV
jgi:Glu-tRNA(Gln) amidotransferase subunit E-like FAD-binding protein